jgi:hypothetical protein
MNAFKINRGSLHYRIAHNYGGYDKDEHRGDICAYTRRILLGMFFIAVIIVAGALAAICVTDLFMALGFIIFSTGSLQGPGIIALGVVLAFLVTAAYIYAMDKWSEKRRAARYHRREMEEAGTPLPDSFLSTAYKAWKDKYCMKIELVD